jgi:cytochrome o ubiquinol oxidase subunit 1
MLMNIIGKLKNYYETFPYLLEPANQQYIIFTLFIFIIFAAILLISYITYNKKWFYLWKNWITTMDHKKIGIMYIIVAFVMLFRGFTDAVMIRVQQALSSGSNYGYLIPEHFDQIFTAHGVIMIFFVAMPLMFGLINIIIPLQIGARDVAFPLLNAISFWLFLAGVLLTNVSLIIGDFSHAGWLAYPPLSSIECSPSVGVDYYIWSLQVSGIGSLMSGINFFVTIINMRCKGMNLMRMPIFTWTVFCSMILVIAAFPVLTITLTLLSLDRYLDMHFFTTSFGGNQMMYINLIWIWGHPEVYILILPSFGIFSEVASVFARKKIFGYKTMIWASLAITLLSFLVWLHHFFTMGAGANVNAFFGIMTMVIAIPTGAKIFNWLFTMYGGCIKFKTPMYWLLGFLIIFSIGGMSGVLLSVPGINFQLHNSVFVVAHFHNVIIGGVIFGYFSGLLYWFPKIFGFKLNEKIGKYIFWFWVFGFLVAFIPVYILGSMGMSRRLYHYNYGTGFQPLLVIACCGSLIIAIGILFQILQIIYSVRNKGYYSYKNNNKDPWNGRTLEWSTSSPPKPYNFIHIPIVDSSDAFWKQKRKKLNVQNENKRNILEYKAIHIPKNSGIGFIIGIFSFSFGFSMVWHIWWLTILSVSSIVASVIIRALNSNTEINYKVKNTKIMDKN